MATTETERRGRVRVERTRKRLRAYLGGELVFDTTDARLVWEVGRFPPGDEDLRTVTPGLPRLA